MAIVFVHGVAVRDVPGSPAYDNGVAKRNNFLRNTLGANLIGSADTPIVSPYWGKFPPAIPHPNPIVALPGNLEGIQALGAGGSQPLMLAGVASDAQAIGAAPKNRKVLELAKRSFPEAIDQIWAELANDKAPANAKQIFETGLLASAYAEEHEEPKWVEEVADDEEFLERLKGELEKWKQAPAAPAGDNVPANFQSLGINLNVFDWAKDALGAIQDGISNITNDALMNLLKVDLSDKVTLFFGDVFFYLAERDTTALINGAITQEIRAAAKYSKDHDEPLIIMAHSMGGNIVYDLLTHYLTDVEVDAFITVGCQASLFKQLSLFKEQTLERMPLGPAGANAEGKAPKPPGVDKWINIFDVHDVLSFKFQDEFAGVTDYSYSSPGGFISAHGDYFERITFYERVVARLK
jgi:hypothetical protein